MYLSLCSSTKEKINSVCWRGSRNKSFLQKWGMRNFRSVCLFCVIELWVCVRVTCKKSLQFDKINCSSAEWFAAHLPSTCFSAPVCRSFPQNKHWNKYITTNPGRKQVFSLAVNYKRWNSTQNAVLAWYSSNSGIDAIRETQHGSRPHLRFNKTGSR